MPKKTFTFRSNQIIGAASAETDSEYLNNCFVDTGDLAVLRNTRDPRNILVGRTGSGKSALLIQLREEEDHVIQISPEALSLSYISNSNTIKFFTDAGVKMDIFYRLLWRHIFCVEVLKERFGIDNEQKKQNFLDRLWTVIPQKKQHEKALAYLKTWGESFWEETEYRIKEVTTKLESELKASVEGKVPNLLTMNGGVSKVLTDEQKADVVHRAQEVVNRVQIRELSDVINLIDDVLLADRQQKYFITIDRLDEDWVEDNLRYRLIRALIETSVELSRIENLKVILAIRSDLLDRVYRYTRDAGFQEEKFQDCSLDISWRRPQLIEVLESRIDYLIKNQYTNEKVGSKDIMPDNIGKQSPIDYMLDRTLMRPRDIIHFFNACIKRSDGKVTITSSTIRDAEGYYSRDRLKALFDEWQGLYPNLSHLYQLLKIQESTFLITDISDDSLQENLLQLLASNDKKYGIDHELMLSVYNGQITFEEYRREIIHIFYRVGLIGLKIDTTSPYTWSHISGITVSSSEITNNTKVQVHKTFWRVLGIYDKGREGI